MLPGRPLIGMCFGFRQGPYRCRGSNVLSVYGALVLVHIVVVVVECLDTGVDCRVGSCAVGRSWCCFGLVLAMVVVGVTCAFCIDVVGSLGVRCGRCGNDIIVSIVHAFVFGVFNLF